VRLLSDRTYRDACGAAGRQRVLRHFSRERFARQVQAELERALEPAAARAAARQATT
jgi:hypothetical protein